MRFAQPLPVPLSERTRWVARDKPDADRDDNDDPQGLLGLTSCPRFRFEWEAVRYLRVLLVVDNERLR